MKSRATRSPLSLGLPDPASRFKLQRLAFYTTLDRWFSIVEKHFSLSQVKAVSVRARVSSLGAPLTALPRTTSGCPVPESPVPASWIDLQ